MWPTISTMRRGGYPGDPQVLAEAAHKDLMTQRKAALKFEVPVAAMATAATGQCDNLRQSNIEG